MIVKKKKFVDTRKVLTDENTFTAVCIDQRWKYTVFRITILYLLLNKLSNILSVNYEWKDFDFCGMFSINMALFEST